MSTNPMCRFFTCCSSSPADDHLVLVRSGDRKPGRLTPCQGRSQPRQARSNRVAVALGRREPPTPSPRRTAARCRATPATACRASEIGCRARAGHEAPACCCGRPWRAAPASSQPTDYMGTRRTSREGARSGAANAERPSSRIGARWVQCSRATEDTSALVGQELALHPCSDLLCCCMTGASRPEPGQDRCPSPSQCPVS